jgi:ASC-1-like (ASCH) protein
MVSHLEADIFDLFKNGKKDIEVRVNDEKRRNIKIGDKITFLKRPDEIEKLETTVVDLNYYSNFEELVNFYDIKRLYYPNYTKENYLNDLGKFYSKEEQIEYGVVAIIVEKQ